MITSTSNELVVSLSKLQMKKHRDNENKFLVSTPKLIKEAINAGFSPCLVLHLQDYDVSCFSGIKSEIVSCGLLLILYPRLFQ